MHMKPSNLDKDKLMKEINTNTYMASVEWKLQTKNHKKGHKEMCICSLDLQKSANEKLSPIYSSRFEILFFQNVMMTKDRISA